jgi:hypothetical protein
MSSEVSASGTLKDRILKDRSAGGEYGFVVNSGPDSEKAAAYDAAPNVTGANTGPDSGFNTESSPPTTTKSPATSKMDPMEGYSSTAKVGSANGMGGVREFNDGMNPSTLIKLYKSPGLFPKMIAGAGFTACSEVKSTWMYGSHFREAGTTRPPQDTENAGLLVTGSTYGLTLLFQGSSSGGYTCTLLIPRTLLNATTMLHALLPSLLCMPRNMVVERVCGDPGMPSLSKKPPSLIPTVPLKPCHATPRLMVLFTMYVNVGQEKTPVCAENTGLKSDPRASTPTGAKATIASTMYVILGYKGYKDSYNICPPKKQLSPTKLALQFRFKTGPVLHTAKTGAEKWAAMKSFSSYLRAH